MAYIRIRYNISTFSIFYAKKKIPFVEKNIISTVAKVRHMYLKKKEINYSKKITFQKVSDIASQLAALFKVRKILLYEQRRFRCLPGLIAEGRDMGITVFPDAMLKFFLDAKLESRVHRRFFELKKNGYHTNFQKLLKEMKIRDERDQNRLISPLYPSENAIILDSTNMSFNEVINFFMKLYHKKINIYFAKK